MLLWWHPKQEYHTPSSQWNNFKMEYTKWCTRDPHENKRMRDQVTTTGRMIFTNNLLLVQCRRRCSSHDGHCEEVLRTEDNQIDFKNCLMWTLTAHQMVEHCYFALNYARTWRTTDLANVCPSNTNVLRYAETCIAYHPTKEDKSRCGFKTKQTRKRARHGASIQENV